MYERLFEACFIIFMVGPHIKRSGKNKYHPRTKIINRFYMRYSSQSPS